MQPTELERHHAEPQPTPVAGGEGPQRTIGMRLVITLVGIALVVVAVAGAGAVAERNARNALMQELEARLLAEARHLAVASSASLLADVPELTLHAMINEMQAPGTDLAFAYVVDLDGVVLGHQDVSVLGTRYEGDPTLQLLESRASLRNGETLAANENYIAARVPIRHTNNQLIGRVLLGFDRSGVNHTLATARRQLLLFLVPVLVGAVALTLVLMGRLLRPIKTLRTAIESIAAGNLATRVDVSTRTELGVLGRAINEMAGELELAREHMRDKERLDIEMNLARNIQHSLLPRRSLVRGDFVVTGSQTAAFEVGGDYYDVLELDDSRVGIVIADVSGKGLGGCLVASMLAVLVRSFAPHVDSPSKLLLEVERGLAGSIQRGTFVTMFYGILDTRSGVLTHASAAHNPLFHYHLSDGSITATRTNGVPIAASRDGLKQSLHDESVSIAAGDVLLQTTDGLNEAVNEAVEQFGFDRICEVFKEHAQFGNHALLEELQTALDSWEPNTMPSDDRTMLVIERTATMLEHNAALPAPEDHEAAPIIGQAWNARARADSRLSLPARMDALELIGGWLRQCKALATDAPSIESVELGLMEMCANTIEHGYVGDASERIEIWWFAAPPNDSASDTTLLGRILVHDTGRPYNVAAGAARSATEPDATGRGLGLSIVRSSFNEILSAPGCSAGNLTLLTVISKPKLGSQRNKPCLDHTELISFD